MHNTLWKPLAEFAFDWCILSPAQMTWTWQVLVGMVFTTWKNLSIFDVPVCQKGMRPWRWQSNHAMIPISRLLFWFHFLPGMICTLLRSLAIMDVLSEVRVVKSCVICPSLTLRGLSYVFVLVDFRQRRRNNIWHDLQFRNFRLNVLKIWKEAFPRRNFESKITLSVSVMAKKMT